jgi:hypothetical protein
MAGNWNSGHKGNPNSLANLRRGNPLSSRKQDPKQVAGGPSKDFRELCKGSLMEKYAVVNQILAAYEQGDKEVRVDHVLRALDLLYRWSGMDVQRVAQTTAEGEDIPQELDRAALDALLEARKKELGN